MNTKSIIIISLQFLCCICFAQRDYDEIHDLITPNLVKAHNITSAIIDEGDSKKEIKFNAKGKIEKITSYEEDNLINIEYFNYDNDRLDSIIIENIKGNELGKSIFLYEAGRLVQVNSKDVASNVRNQVLHYGQNGKLISSKQTQIFSWGDTCITKYSYNSFEQIDTIFSSKCVENGYSVDFHVKDTLITITYNNNGEIKGENKIIFNTDNQPIYEIGYSIDNLNDSEKLYEKTVFKYNKNELLIEVSFYKKSVNEEDYKLYNIIGIHYK